MRPTAIQLAFQLAKQPNKMDWLCSSETPLSDGTTDLLRLCSSSKRLEQFSKKININPLTIRKVLVNYIEKVLVTDQNNSNKILGLSGEFKPEQLKLHYQLLMKIFHPDLSISKQASQKAAIITKSYKAVKTELEEPQQFKNIKLSRVPPKSFYRATRKAEAHHSRLKNTSIIFGGMALVSLAIIVSFLLQTSKPELISKPPQVTLISKEASSSITPAPEIARPNEFSVSKANFSGSMESDTTESILQMMLRDIETYYEKGIVKLIKPILANTPEMRSQTDEDMQIKLETLFNITQKRKMLLYDFEWRNISGHIQGKGKFISRYQMTGQMNWETRKGIAIVTAKEKDGSYSVTGLQLENNIVD